MVVVVAQQLKYQPTNLEIVGSNPAEDLILILSFPSFLHFSLVSLNRSLKEVHFYLWYLNQEKCSAGSAA